MMTRLIRTFVAAAVVLAVAGTAQSAGKGRYKKEGDLCVWNATDDGPNQCTPKVEGRFKKVGNNCVWEAKDKGEDQCRPKGRFKKDGDHCVWTANDDGPDQCNPRQPR
jgi:hypothetical protein